MSLNRIQKLLFSEYCEFEDMVLVESPFAETTREGKGIRQVHLGLTPTKLIVATDVITPAKESSFWCLQDVDPDIETFELISVYPIDCVNLSIFRRKKRQSLKAHFCNNKVLYFELGGFEKRKMFWNLWCERVKFLCPEDLGSSHTETSVASSTSNSTMFLKKVNKTFPTKGKPQIWCTFAAGDSKYAERKRWTDRELFFDKFDETNYFYISEQNKDVETIYTNESTKKRKTCYSMSSCESLPCFQDTVENVDKLHTANRFSLLEYQTNNYVNLRNQGRQKNLNDLSIESVEIWEKEATKNKQKIDGVRKKHKRIYGFFPQSHFYYGLGPWNISPGDRVSVQMKRAVSLVNIRRQPTESGLRLPISKRQLTTSISYESSLNQPKLATASVSNQAKLHKTDSLLHFWTPEFWYRPKPFQNIYKELCFHMKNIQEYHETINKPTDVKRRFLPKKFFKSPNHLTNQEEKNKISKRSKCNIPVARNNTKDIVKIKDYQNDDESQEKKINMKDNYLQSLRQKLCLHIVLSAWDFDSTTLAYQLTMIDRDLFLKLEEAELSVLVWQRSSKNAPNISALIAFSHRVSSLITTEILREEIEKLRARLIARFITTADKCNKIFNFQSCRSILYGLQSPPIYRLHSTWSYVRKKHASKYFVFEKLCRLYRDPRMPNYQRAFYRARQNHPYIPYIGDLLVHLLDKLPEMSDDVLSQSSNEKYKGECIVGPVHTLSSFHNKPSFSSNDSSLPNILRRFLSAFRIWPHSYLKPKELRSEDNESTTKHLQENAEKSEPINHKLTDREILYAKTCDFFKSSAFYVDNRKMRLQEVSNLLNEFQKACLNYALCTSDLANEYLLKARYRENRENFIYSFEIESHNC